MSVPTQSFETTQARRWTIANPRLRLKPEHGSAGFVQGGWWPRTDQLHTELPLLLAALSSRSGTVDRVIYDENSWAPASLRMEFRGHSVILESTNTSDNTLTVLGNQFGTLVLLVVPPRRRPRRCAHGRDDRGQPRRRVDRRGTAANRDAGAGGPPSINDTAAR
jgi:hypothetical protein